MGSEKIISRAEETPVSKTVDARNADVTLRLLEEHGHKFGPLTLEKEQKLRRIIYWRLMTLLIAINIVLFVRYSISAMNWSWLTVPRLTNPHLAMPPFWDCSRRLRSRKHNSIT